MNNFEDGELIPYLTIVKLEEILKPDDHNLYDALVRIEKINYPKKIEAHYNDGYTKMYADSNHIYVSLYIGKKEFLTYQLIHKQYLKSKINICYADD